MKLSQLMCSAFACLLMGAASYCQDAAPRHSATSVPQSSTHLASTDTVPIHMLLGKVLSLILERTDSATQVAQTLVCRGWYVLTRANQIRQWWFDKVYVEIFPVLAAYPVPCSKDNSRKDNILSDKVTSIILHLSC